MATGGLFASLGKIALKSADVDPLANPALLVCRLADGLLSRELGPRPVCRMPESAPVPDFDVVDRIVVFKHDRDPRVCGLRVHKGLAMVILAANGIDVTGKNIDELASFTALPDEVATVEIIESHPFAPPDFLKEQIARRGFGFLTEQTARRSNDVNSSTGVFLKWFPRA